MRPPAGGGPGLPTRTHLSLGERRCERRRCGRPGHPALAVLSRHGRSIVPREAAEDLFGWADGARWGCRRFLTPPLLTRSGTPAVRRRPGNRCSRPADEISSHVPTPTNSLAGLRPRIRTPLRRFRRRTPSGAARRGRSGGGRSCDPSLRPGPAPCRIARGSAGARSHRALPLTLPLSTVSCSYGRCAARDRSCCRSACDVRAGRRRRWRARSCLSCSARRRCSDVSYRGT